MKILLIGGTNDGRRLDLDCPRENLQMPQRGAWDRVVSISRGPSLYETLPIEFYNLQRLRSGDTIFEVYVHENLSLTQAMRLLIDNYQGAT